ncbi:hypothetical protein [Mucisphaera calidilacus]|uniref:Uncharacterized protein n=1 Tax=Mucisphaera calidilacus TaxID=2527982 RepID=A0A518C0P9_9BACT|nr:hypothetical protein [Mucisphaera calidilacus]QDU72787.1 hypothetical protein Pan265_26610 [Mucisphaera calidilacus]
MSKLQLIESIRRVNRTASEEFLTRFDETTLHDYLRRLSLQQRRGPASTWTRNTTIPAVTTRVAA